MISFKIIILIHKTGSLCILKQGFDLLIWVGKRKKISNSRKNFFGNLKKFIKLFLLCFKIGLFKKRKKIENGFDRN
jgi:hypothetical protein